MRALVFNELYKISKQSRTYYLLAAIFLLEAVILYGAHSQGREIIDILLDNLKTTFYFEGELLNGNLLVYLILNTLWFHMPLILIIGITGLITSEYKDGTLQAIMLQPVVKWKFIVSKYITAVLFTLLIVFFLALSSFFFSYLFFGKGDLVVYLGTLNFFEADEAFYRLKWAFASGALTMVFYSVVSLTFGILFREATKAWILSAFFLILSNLLLKVDFDIAWVNALFFPKLVDTWQWFFLNEIQWGKIMRNNALLLGYTFLAMGTGIYVFQKRDIG